MMKKGDRGEGEGEGVLNKIEEDTSALPLLVMKGLQLFCSAGNARFFPFPPVAKATDLGRQIFAFFVPLQ